MIEFVTGLAAGCVITGAASYAIYRGKITELAFSRDSLLIRAEEYQELYERMETYFWQKEAIIARIHDHFSKGKSGTARLVVKMAKGEAA